MIKVCYFLYHRKRRPGFYSDLSSREIAAHINKIRALQAQKFRALRREELDKLREQRGHITLEGEDLKLVLEGLEDENPQCCICMDGCVVSEDENSSGVQQTECGHWFHRDCLADWKLRKDTCPMCRKTFKQP